MILSLGKIKKQIRQLVNDANDCLLDNETTRYSENETSGFCYVVEAKNGYVTRIRIYTEHCK